MLMGSCLAGCSLSLFTNKSVREELGGEFLLPLSYTTDDITEIAVAFDSSSQPSRREGDKKTKQKKNEHDVHY